MDGFFGIGFLELVLIAIVALIVLGPERLPGVMREGAGFIKRVRQLASEFTNQFSEEFRALDEINPKRLLDEYTDPLKVNPPAKKAPGTPASGTPAAVAGAAKPKATVTPAPAAKPATQPAAAAQDSATAASPQAPADGAEPEHTILPPDRLPQPESDAPADSPPTPSADESERTVQPSEAP